MTAIQSAARPTPIRRATSAILAFEDFADPFDEMQERAELELLMMQPRFQSRHVDDAGY